VNSPRVALIHATAVAMPPTEAAFRRLWPAAERVNLLDDSLARDRERSADLTPALFQRIGRLAGYARDVGAVGILFTCSAFGAAIEAAARSAPGPVLKPNEAMFEAALGRGRRIGLLATFPLAVASMAEEFRDLARERGAAVELRAHCVPAALDALRAGDPAAHDALLAEGALELAGADAIMLAQFSMARAEPVVAARAGVPVLTSPGTAVLKLKAALGA
jgi:Asp/Glu/hydantoin racemase